MTPSTHTPTGQDLKAAGQALALFNEPTTWVERFLAIAREYLASLPDGHLFAMEDVRAYADAQGLPIAQTDRSRKAHSPRTHAHRVMLWVKKGGN